MKITPLFIFVIILFASCKNKNVDSSLQEAKNYSLPQKPSSIFGPHASPQKGPWFEGWYVRVTDSKEHRSFAIIVASQITSKEQFIPGSGTSGYLAVITQDGQGNTTKSFEAYPSKTFVKVDGHELGTSKVADNSDFVWEAPGFGWFSPKGFDLEIPKKVHVEAQLSGKKAWNEHWKNWGPEGYGTFMKFVPLHWFVESLASYADYTLRSFDAHGSEVIHKSTGLAHLEKNWGEAFPKAWVWMQAVDPVTSDAIAVAGGVLAVGALPFKTYLAGYKSKQVNAEFHMGQLFDMTYTDRIESCSGIFEVTLQNGEHTMIVKAKADPKSFASVSIPTENGWQSNAGKESFNAEIEIEVHNNNWVKDLVLQDSLIEKKVFKKAALEFGADFMKCP